MKKGHHNSIDKTSRKEPSNQQDYQLANDPKIMSAVDLLAINIPCWPLNSLSKSLKIGFFSETLGKLVMNSSCETT